MNTKKKQKQYKQRFVYPDEALRNFFVKGLMWNDIATRSEYWWAWLLLSLMGVFVSIIPMLGLLFGLLMYIPYLALTARRWNDLGYNGAKLAIFELLFIPVGFLLFTVIGVLLALMGGGFVSGLFDFFALYFIIGVVFGIVKIIFFCMPSKIGHRQYSYTQQRSVKKQYASTTMRSYYQDDEE